jgi:hypothetical protein
LSAAKAFRRGAVPRRHFGAAMQHQQFKQARQSVLSVANNFSIIGYMSLYLLSKIGYNEIVESYRE